jgi:hypothetical protein
MALQIDGGSEFKAAFERACREPGVLKTQLALGPFHPEPMVCYPKGGQVLPIDQYTALRPAPVMWYEFTKAFLPGRGGYWSWGAV